MTMPSLPENTEPSQLLLDQLADKWTLRILRTFCPGFDPVRFNEIKRRVSGISQKTLTQCLRNLERSGILQRRVISAAPLGVEYSITPLGMTLEEPLNSLHVWAERHVPRVLKAQQKFDAEKNHTTRGFSSSIPTDEPLSSSGRVPSAITRKSSRNRPGD